LSQEVKAVVKEGAWGQGVVYIFNYTSAVGPGAGQKTPEIFVHASSNEK